MLVSTGKKKMITPQKKYLQINALSLFTSVAEKDQEKDTKRILGEDLHHVSVNVMNIWQTIDILSGNDIRRKYTPYEGYHDSNDILKLFKPATGGGLGRRDSFSSKTPSKPVVEDSSAIIGSVPVPANASPRSRRDTLIPSGPRITLTTSVKLPGILNEKKRRRRKKKSLDLSAEELPIDIIHCTFSLPKVSARLERLMGTNVIRLTDRKYMKELRIRIEEDYLAQLAKRVEMRQAKEIERERNLILEGKTDTIPEYLAHHPVFLADKTTMEVINHRRSKLKTNREKNAERLIRQGAKWERERLLFEEMERKKKEAVQKFKRKMRMLQRRFSKDNAKKGLNLIRIKTENWRASELQLKKFLEKERYKMKARFWAGSKPYINDPKDIVYIDRAREKFRELELQIRSEVENEIKGDDPKALANATSTTASRITRYLTAIDSVESDQSYPSDGSRSGDSEYSDLSMPSTTVETVSDEIDVMGDLEEESRKRVQQGFLMSKETFAGWRYEDPKISKLKLAKSIKEIYKLAEEIIIGELAEIEELDYGEEEGEDELEEEYDY